jgi:hypothetical protein
MAIIGKATHGAQTVAQREKSECVTTGINRNRRAEQRGKIETSSCITPREISNCSIFQASGEKAKHAAQREK